MLTGVNLNFNCGEFAVIKSQVGLDNEVAFGKPRGQEAGRIIANW